MDSNINFLELCTHLKSEWTPVFSQNQPTATTLYQHKYSSDQCEAVRLTSVSLKDLDLYSNRQAYSHPFCPKIYKYIIQKNLQKGNELMFDIVLLVEKVSQRVNNLNLRKNSRMVKSLASKTSEIVSGFDYLFRRFGSFAITEEMIGLTELGVLKVWINEDFYLNSKSELAQKQEEMVQQLVKILQDKNILKKTIKKCESFQSLLTSLQFIQEKKQSDYVKKHVAFRPIDNLNCSLNDYKPSLKAEKAELFPTSPQSKKNITFSYSNKDLNQQIDPKVFVKQATRLPANKRCSIELDSNQFSHLLMRSPISNECSGIVVGPKTPSASISSNKTINAPFVRSQKKKLSCFNDEKNSQYQSVDRQTTVKKFKEQFSKTTQSSANKKEGSGIDSSSKLFKNYKGTPESLHYSTSSNPLSKFFRNKRIEEKTYSTKGEHTKQDESYLEEKSKNGSNESQLSYKVDQKLKQEVKGALQTFKIVQEEANLRQSQEVKKDLDALFNSQNSFNYDELQTELDGIL